MSDHIDQVDSQTMAEMRAWAEGVGYESLLGDEVVAARDMTDAEVMALADRQYPGGVESFSRRDDDLGPHGQWT